MTIERNYAGAWVVSDIVAGYLVTRQYYYYTKREATAKFKADLKSV